MDYAVGEWRTAVLNEPKDAGYLVNRAIIAFEGLQAQWRRVLSINAHERLALAHLWESGPMTMSELGERIPLSRAAVTSLTDRLEALGYVRRTPDMQDRRRTVLSLTEVPQQKLTGLASRWSADMKELANGMPDEEWQVIVKFLDRFREVGHSHASLLRALSDEDLMREAEAAGASVGE